MYRLMVKIRSNQWGLIFQPCCYIQKLHFSLQKKVGVHEKLKEKLFGTPLFLDNTIQKKSDEICNFFKNRLDYQIQNHSNLYQIFSHEFKGSQLGNSLLQLLSTLSSIRYCEDIQAAQKKRQKQVSDEEIWFKSVPHHIQQDFYQLKRRHVQYNLMTFIYIDCDLNLEKLYWLGRQENFELNKICEKELEKLRYIGLNYEQSVDFSDFFPQLKFVINKIITQKNELKRLAWIGDAVVHSYVSQQMLINEKFSNPYISSYVSRRALEKIAREMKFDVYIYNEFYEQSSWEVLAELVEALIGYIFLIKQDIHASGEWLLESKQWTEDFQEQDIYSLQNLIKLEKKEQFQKYSLELVYFEILYFWNLFFFHLNQFLEDFAKQISDFECASLEKKEQKTYSLQNNVVSVNKGQGQEQGQQQRQGQEQMQGQGQGGKGQGQQSFDFSSEGQKQGQVQGFQKFGSQTQQAIQKIQQLQIQIPSKKKIEIYDHILPSKKIKKIFPDDKMKILYCATTLEDKKSLLNYAKYLGVVKQDAEKREFSKQALNFRVISYFQNLKEEERTLRLKNFINQFISPNVLFSLHNKLKSMGLDLDKAL